MANRVLNLVHMDIARIARDGQTLTTALRRSLLSTSSHRLPPAPTRRPLHVRGLAAAQQLAGRDDHAGRRRSEHALLASTATDLDTSDAGNFGTWAPPAPDRAGDPIRPGNLADGLIYTVRHPPVSEIPARPVVLTLHASTARRPELMR
jgi:hypothetical protein